MKRKIFFVAASNARINDGYTSRIFMEINYLRDLFDISIIIPEGKEMAVDFGENVKIIEYPESRKRNKYFAAIDELFLFKKMFLREVPKGRDVLVCGEALIPAFLASRVSKKNGNTLIYDCHGTQPDEYRLYHSGIKGTVIGKCLDIMESLTLRRTDLAVTVNDNQYKKWGEKLDHIKLPMMPADFFLDNVNFRNETRKELGIGENEIVFVYSGRNQKWQMSDQTIKLYSEIAGKIDNTRLLILTPEVSEFAVLIEKYGIKNAIIKSVDYKSMHKYLDACDVGFCLREDHIINKVASPTKVLEYLARDVKPMLTPYVGEFAEELGSRNLAIIMTPEKMKDLPAEDFKFLNIDGKGYVKEFREKTRENYRKKLINI